MHPYLLQCKVSRKENPIPQLKLLSGQAKERQLCFLSPHECSLLNNYSRYSVQNINIDKICIKQKHVQTVKMICDK